MANKIEEYPDNDAIKDLDMQTNKNRKKEIPNPCRSKKVSEPESR